MGLWKGSGISLSWGLWNRRRICHCGLWKDLENLSGIFYGCDEKIFWFTIYSYLRDSAFIAIKRMQFERGTMCAVPYIVEVMFTQWSLLWCSVRLLRSRNLGSKGGTVVRVLTSHQCGLGSNPGVDAICGLSLLLVLSLALRGFFSGYSDFPLSSKTNISKFQFDQEPGRRRTIMWMCYLEIIIYLFII